MIFRNWLETEKQPDYSFDSFVRSAEELKGAKDRMAKDAEGKEKDLDKKIDQKKKEVDQAEKDQPKEPKEPKDPFPMDDKQRELLGKLRDIAKERAEKDKDEK